MKTAVTIAGSDLWWRRDSGRSENLCRSPNFWNECDHVGGGGKYLPRHRHSRYDSFHDSESNDRHFEDIPPDAVKVGMLSSSDCMIAVAEKLREFRPDHVVIDPVMVAKGGCSLMQQQSPANLNPRNPALGGGSHPQSSRGRGHCRNGNPHN